MNFGWEKKKECQMKDQLEKNKNLKMKIKLYVLELRGFKFEKHMTIPGNYFVITKKLSKTVSDEWGLENKKKVSHQHEVDSEKKGNDSWKYRSIEKKIRS